MRPPPLRCTAWTSELPANATQQRRVRAWCRVLLWGVSLAAAIAAGGCAPGRLAAPTNSPTTQAECGRSPGTASTWRPELNYCEY